MTQLSKAAFNTAFNTLFADNTTRDISEADLRTFQTDIKDSAMFITDNFIDEDSMATDSATKAPSQQSVKAYVDGIALVKRARVQITGGASTRAIGTAPQTILAAPGAGFWYNIISVSIAYDYGSAVYNFAAASDINCKFSGTSGGAWVLDYAVMNGGANFNYRLSAVGNDGYNCPENTAFVLTTANGADATTGDGDVQVIVVYTLEAINT
jgi:hypothetical protein